MKILMMLFLIFVYLVPVSVFIIIFLFMTDKISYGVLFIAFIEPILLMIIVCVFVVINIISAVRAILHSNCLTFRTILVFKLSLIPFYIVNYISWHIGSMMYDTSFVVIPMPPYVIAYTYFIMLSTSVHVIAKLFSLRREQLISTKQLVIHGLLQIVFTLDVLDCIYLAIKQKKIEQTLIPQI